MQCAIYIKVLTAHCFTVILLYRICILVRLVLIVAKLFMGSAVVVSIYLHFTALYIAQLSSNSKISLGAEMAL